VWLGVEVWGHNEEVGVGDDGLLTGFAVSLSLIMDLN
jgi:hypothetical protein